MYNPGLLLLIILLEPFASHFHHTSHEEPAIFYLSKHKRTNSNLFGFDINSTLQISVTPQTGNRSRIMQNKRQCEAGTGHFIAS